jgi:hypothetical protein
MDSREKIIGFPEPDPQEFPHRFPMNLTLEILWIPERKIIGFPEPGS